ncbi:MAG: esterase/lipase family protein [Nitrospiria bacterium]
MTYFEAKIWSGVVKRNYILALLSLSLIPWYSSCVPIRSTEVDGNQKQRSCYAPGYVVSPVSKDRILVFVHGLFGDGCATWKNQENRFFWEFFENDPVYKDTAVYDYGFPSSFLGSNAFSIDQAVADLALHLENDKVFSHKQVVAHSMGGLVVMRYLLSNRQFAGQVPLAYFYATPQEGAAITRIVKFISDNPGVASMEPGDSNQYLQNLDSEWKKAQEDGRVV